MAQKIFLRCKLGRISSYAKTQCFSSSFYHFALLGHWKPTFPALRTRTLARMELPIPAHLAYNSTPSAQPSKAAARVSPASLSGSASWIRLSSSAGSKSRSFMGDSAARSPVVSCSASLNYNGAPVPEAPVIGTDGRIREVKRVTKETNVSMKINLDGTGVSYSSTGIPFLDHMLDESRISGRL